MITPLALGLALALAAAPPTFRVDFFHTGSATEERFALDRLVLETHLCRAGSMRRAHVTGVPGGSSWP